MTGSGNPGWSHLSLLLVVACLPVQAAQLTDQLDTTLSLRSDVWGGSRKLDDVGGIVQAAAWGRLKLDMDQGDSIVANGWVREQSGANADAPHARVRELYWRHSQGQLELKLGRQLAIWGRADGINPTDNLTPRDLTLLTPEDTDQRTGTDALQLRLSTGLGSVSALWMAHAASHTVPLAAQPNVRFTVEQPRQASQWALKWDVGGEGYDGSISYFHGIDPMPDLVLASVAAQGVNVAVRNHHAQILGADFSFTRGAFVWRAEAAAMQTDSVGASDFTHKKPQLWMVAGGEYSFDDGTTLGLQASLLHVKNFSSPDDIADPVARAIAWRQAATSNQTSANQHGFTWRLARRWRNDTLMAETSGMLVWPSRSGIWRAKLGYAIDDHWYMQAGTDYYFGPENSFFGQLSKNRLLYVQLRYGW